MNARRRTLTYLSQPAETMIGFWLLGENLVKEVRMVVNVDGEGGDMTSQVTSGGDLTQETQSWWPSSWMVYLHWASVFHNCEGGYTTYQAIGRVHPNFAYHKQFKSSGDSGTLMVLSLAADTICLLSAEKATESTSLVWSSNLRVVLPVERSHRRSVLSQEPDSAKWPSELGRSRFRWGAG